MANRPGVSVIIPIAPGGECEQSLASVRSQNYDKKKIQLLVGIGRHRSIQRNTALSKAKGDIIWFMDNDVEIRDPEYLNKSVAHFENERVASVGGPSLTPDSDSFLQRTIGQVLGSFFATQAARSRYRARGKVRETDEKELILCSQTFRASAIAGSCFDERLHSGNEENELMNRLKQAGHTMVYDPDLPVWRSQRGTLLQFIQQMGKYGKSRMEHFLIKPSAFETMFMVPLFFLTYLAALAVAGGGMLLGLLPIPPLYFGIMCAPLALYSLLNIGSSLQAAVRGRSFAMFFASLMLFPMVHIFYGLGNLVGIKHRITGDTRDIPEVVVQEIKL